MYCYSGQLSALLTPRINTTTVGLIMMLLLVWDVIRSNNIYLQS
uniref:Uncharacterized protein n=1 Tax=Arundo donax TaxID=35708 RepID=A0A0A9EJX9_ARUDO